MRTSICGRGQRAFQNRYIFRPDDAREERKVGCYSVLSSLTVERVASLRPKRFTAHLWISGVLRGYTARLVYFDLRGVGGHRTCVNSITEI